MKTLPYSLTALGMVNALGQEKKAIWHRVLKGDQTALTVQKGYLPRRGIRVGQVLGRLPAFPNRFKKYKCRNNALALAAFQEIQPALQTAVEKYGAERIGVVIGSSTSGMAATESAFKSWRQSGRLRASFDYVQHEMGGVSEFLALLAGAPGTGLYDFHRLLFQRQGVCLGSGVDSGWVV